MRIDEKIEKYMSEGSVIYLDWGGDKNIKAKNVKDVLRKLKANLGDTDFEYDNPLSKREIEKAIKNNETVFVILDPYAEDIHGERELLFFRDRNEADRAERSRAADV